jgi:hypothetical protein
MCSHINTEDESAFHAAVDSVLASTASKKSGSSKRKGATKGLKLRKPKLESLKGSKKPSKASPLAEGSSFKNTLIERSTADERLRAFMRGELELDGQTYDSDLGRQYTLEEIGRVMGVSRERVRQIEEHSLRKLWRLLDIMSKRENLNQQDWLSIFDNGSGDGDTVYFPG